MGCSMDRCNDGVSLSCHGRKPTRNFTRIAHDMRAMAPTGSFSVVYAHTHGNTVRDRARSSPKTALPHAEITDPDIVPMAFRTRCIGCCAMHTPWQHHRAKLA